MEHLLHYVWKHKLFPLKVLQTTNGLPVEVIDSGLQNPNAGPDFFNAKLKIDGALWVGNIEIHTHSSDWFRHGHDCDKAYDSVILHVVSEADTEITRTNGEQIPQLLLTCPENVQSHYHELCVADHYPACYPILASLPKLTIHSWLTALQPPCVRIQSMPLPRAGAVCCGSGATAGCEIGRASCRERV